LKQIRILIVAMPRMLHEIVETVVSSQPDMTVTEPVRRRESVAAAARRVRADIVILGESNDEPGEAPWRVLEENPSLKLLIIANNGHRATRYELRPHQVVIGDISPEDIIDAVRASMVGASIQNSLGPAIQSQRRSDDNP
jgi:DNA-binding NarL/FixJ family response regulator